MGERCSAEESRKSARRIAQGWRHRVGAGLYLQNVHTQPRHPEAWKPHRFVACLVCVGLFCPSGEGSRKRAPEMRDTRETKVKKGFVQISSRQPGRSPSAGCAMQRSHASFARRRMSNSVHNPTPARKTANCEFSPSSNERPGRASIRVPAGSCTTAHAAPTPPRRRAKRLPMESAEGGANARRGVGAQGRERKRNGQCAPESRVRGASRWREAAPKRDAWCSHIHLLVTDEE